MSVENLEGMSSEQLMLRDVIYELNEILNEARDASFDQRFGIFQVAKLLKMQLDAFGIDQSRFAQKLIDVDAWFAGQA